jgi:type II secretory pathway component PulJ
MTRRDKKPALAGVTLMELLVAILLLSLLSVGMVISMRIALSAMNKTDSRLMGNRRVVSVERILNEEISGIIPVTADCSAGSERSQRSSRLTFFQGEAQSMRLASTYSLHEGARGMPMILEFQVIPGEENEGVRLVVNEQWYTGSRGAGAMCLGTGSDPVTGLPSPLFVPIQIGSNSFVLSDKLAYCRFSFRNALARPQPVWVDHWILPTLPDAVRIDLAPIAPDAGRLQPVTLTVPIRVTRLPLANYQDELIGSGQ